MPGGAEKNLSTLMIVRRQWRAKVGIEGVAALTVTEALRDSDEIDPLFRRESFPPAAVAFRWEPPRDGVEGRSVWGLRSAPRSHRRASRPSTAATRRRVSRAMGCFPLARSSSLIRLCRVPAALASSCWVMPRARRAVRTAWPKARRGVTVCSIVIRQISPCEVEACYRLTRRLPISS